MTKSASVQSKLHSYLFSNDSKQNLLPVLNFSQAVTVEFGITLIKIKDVVSFLSFPCNSTVGKEWYKMHFDQLVSVVVP